MRKLSDTIARLANLRGAALMDGGFNGSSRLTGLEDFGSNPGALRAHVYTPKSLPSEAALVVVLHGCTQTAAGYDIGAGWSEMADRHGFALLFPEQQRQNNPNLCFNWFSPEDNRRAAGEALSIRQMIAVAADRYSIDPARIFVTGLSAGGAMASVMLATYPEVFAGGAIIAGLPYGCASTIPQAFDSMRGHGIPGEAELAALVRAASGHGGRWPTISIWHGSGDATVNPSNAAAIVGQWRSLHGVDVAPSTIEAVDGYPHRVWRDKEGREVIEEYSITGMAHGTPLHTVGEDGCGRSGAYMLEASISSTHHICRFWGLLEDEGGSQQGPQLEPECARQEFLPVPASAQARDTKTHRIYAQQQPADQTRAPAGVGKVIEDALRAAGLMR
ncbi:PHB depolymerase family esterase [uncultured Sphingomonas sp.]|uniref:extracellular catalytic domain type 1 short-chain-length polyhydroxyalkanoate depolymerase n=1 Tax=uncultured Sphingomonas sp. TaxID=158754 RepID=UPI0025E02173|nr:PHB depolymerase family esterase [uncultured Sphingomonas sp.]